jgi:hypothetical protein
MNRVTFAEVVKGPPQEPPDRTEPPTDNNGIPPMSSPGFWATPRTWGNNTIRVYYKGTPLYRKEVVEAIRSQLKVNPTHAHVCMMKYKFVAMDVELESAEEVKKIQHCNVMIRGVTHRIGPAFSYGWRIVTVLMKNAGPARFQEATDALRAALGTGATFLAATRGSTMCEIPDFYVRVYLRLAPGVDIGDVVPRVIEDDGRPVYIDWYGAPALCVQCNKPGHSYRACPRNAGRLWTPPIGRNQRTNGGGRNGKPTTTASADHGVAAAPRRTTTTAPSSKPGREPCRYGKISIAKRPEKNGPTKPLQKDGHGDTLMPPTSTETVDPSASAGSEMVAEARNPAMAATALSQSGPKTSDEADAPTKEATAATQHGVTKSYGPPE